MDKQSLVGHFITIKRSNGVIENYPIIAQYRSKQSGLMHYVTDTWNQTSQRFIDYCENSYFLSEGVGAISPRKWMFWEKRTDAAKRAFRLQQLLKQSSKRITRARVNLFGNLRPVPVTNYRHAYEMADRTSAVMQYGELEWMDNDGGYLAQCKNLHSKLSEMFRQEMALAGIEID